MRHVRKSTIFYKTYIDAVNMDGASSFVKRWQVVIEYKGFKGNLANACEGKA